MTKIHLAANKGTNGQSIYARCAAKPAGTDKVRRNSRDTYRFMGSPIVSFEAFRETPAAERCAHCVDMGLAARNRHRKEKGLAPVANLFECTKEVGA